MKTLMLSLSFALLNCISLMLASCSTNKEATTNQTHKTNKCLPKLFEEDLELLVASFDAFLIPTHPENGMEGFLELIARMELPEKTDFVNKDLVLADKLLADNFSDYIYTEYLEDLEMIISTPNDNKEDKKIRKRMKVDIDKPYLNCISKTETKGVLIKKYVALQKKNLDMNPIGISRLFLEHKTDEDYGIMLTKKIVAVECYNVLLEAVNRYK